jgi:branched-subunit amino acid ABC-type transport system permease component
MSSRSWSDLSPAAKAAIVTGAAVELTLTVIVLRDLRRRPAARVRGPKAAWVLATFVQPVGPPAYLLLGRRR